VPVSRDLWPWPWPWAHPGCTLTQSPSCASLVAIRPLACEKWLVRTNYLHYLHYLHCVHYSVTDLQTNWLQYFAPASGRGNHTTCIDAMASFTVSHIRKSIAVIVSKRNKFNLDGLVSASTVITTRVARVVLFSAVSVCDFVCLSLCMFICQHDNSWTVRDNHPEIFTASPHCRKNGHIHVGHICRTYTYTYTWHM